MIKSIDFDAITLADFLRLIDAHICSIVENQLESRVQVFLEANGTNPEKPLTTKEACDHLNVSKPILRQMAKEGLIDRYKIQGFRGYRYFASNLNQAYEPENRVKP